MWRPTKWAFHNVLVLTFIRKHVTLDKLINSGISLRPFVLAELFTKRGTFTVINHEFREKLRDTTTKDYKQLAALVVSGVSINDFLSVSGLPP